MIAIRENFLGHEDALGRCADRARRFWRKAANERASRRRRATSLRKFRRMMDAIRHEYNEDPYAVTGVTRQRMLALAQELAPPNQVPLGPAYRSLALLLATMLLLCALI